MEKKVLMFGWEFPPRNQGGLGVACHGIVNGLVEEGVKVHLVLPSAEGIKSSKFKIHDASKKLIKVKIDSSLLAYCTPETYKSLVESENYGIYGKDLFGEVERYKHKAGRFGAVVEHDIIHAHDWMTYPAAIEAKKYSGKPLVMHIHATEFDRSGVGLNQYIYEIEKMGFEHADKIIAVSEYTKQKVVEHYGIDPDKIVVIHNATTQKFSDMQVSDFNKDRKNVLFLGRVTMQKGPEYFVRAARKVVDFEPDVNFIMAGDGDMLGRVINEALDLGLEHHMIFTGFLRGEDVDKAFQNADLFVMPSVSEPFGLVALESIQNGTPVLVSNQAGVSEVIPNMLRVDFWDVDEMANKIIMALRYPEIREELTNRSKQDLAGHTWRKQASKIKDLYHTLA